MLIYFIGFYILRAINCLFLALQRYFESSSKYILSLLCLAAEVEIKVEQAKKTEVEINQARELYRPGAARASLLYFILNDLNKIHPMYQFSLKVKSKPRQSS